MVTTTHQTKFVLSASDKTKVAVKSATAGMQKLDGIVGKLGVGFAGLAGIGGIGLLISRQVEGAKQAQAYSEALGINIESLTAWQFAAESVGIQADKMADIMKDVTEKIGDAYRNKGGEAKEALDGLNLSIEDMAKLSPDQQLLNIAKALNQVQTQGEKVQIMEALANDATLLLPLLKDDSKELKRLMELADETGATLTKIEADKLVEAGKATKEFSAATDGLTQALAVSLVPVLTTTVEWLTDVVTIGRKAGAAIEGVIEAIIGKGEIQFSADIEASQARLSAMLEYRNELEEGDNKNKDAKIQRLDGLIFRQKQRIELAKKAAEYEDTFRKKPISIVIEKSSSTVGGTDPDQKEKDAAQAKLNRLQESLFTEEQTLQLSFSNKMAIAQEANDLKILADENHLQLIYDLNAEHEGKLAALKLKSMTNLEKFQAMSSKNQVKTVVGELVNITSGVAQHNRKLFELNKVAGIANAIISTHAGVAKSLENYPMPLAAAMAAAHLAAGIAQVEAIKGTSFGSGPSASSMPFAPSDTATQPVQQVPSLAPQSSGTNITVIIEGSAIGNENVREVVIEAMETAIDNDETGIFD